MRSLPNIHDIIADIVDSIRKTGLITNSVEVNGKYTLTTDNELRQYEYITINDVDYKIYSASSTEIVIKAVTGLDFTGEPWKSKEPYYMHEKLKKANLVLSEKDKDDILKYQKYPLVLLLHPYTVDESNPDYAVISDLKIGIFNNTQREWYSDDRYENNFDNVLKPIYYDLIEGIKNSDKFTLETNRDVAHSRIDNLFFDNNPLPDELDSIIIEPDGLQLYYDNTCETSERTTYNLNLSTEGGGITEPYEGSEAKPINSTQAINAVPYEGFSFVRWLINGVEDLNKLTTVTMTKTINAIAEFIGYFTLNISSDGNGTTTPVTGSYEIESGAYQEIEGIPDEGNQFVEFDIDGDIVTDNPYQLLMNGAKNVIAYFISSLTEILYCINSGTAYADYNFDIFTELEFEIIKGNESNTSEYYIISNNQDILLTDGYVLHISNTERILLFRTSGSTLTTLFYSAPNYIAIGETYSIKITRTINGVLRVYIKGGIYDNYILVAPDVGDNPILDNTYSTSDYINLNNDSSDITSRWTVGLNLFDNVVIGDSTIAAYLKQTEVSNFFDNKTDSLSNSIAQPGATINSQLTAWNNITNKISYNNVIIQVGLNDLDPTEAATTTIAILQNLVDTVRTDIGVSKNIYISCMLLCKQRLIDIYGATDGLTSYQKLLDINDAIMGNGSNPITNVDARNNYHVDILSDANGDLKPEYDMGDHIHPNNLGREVIADGWELNFNVIINSKSYSKIDLNTFINGTGNYEVQEI